MASSRSRAASSTGPFLTRRIGVDWLGWRFASARVVAGRILGLVAAGCLLSGCGSPRAHERHGAAPSKAKSATIAKLSTDDPEEFERRVRASALFATGLLEQYRDKGDAALDSLYQAALLDPAHEQLVLDVSSRLILFKKDAASAATLLEKAARLPSSSGRVQEYLALAYLNLGSADKAARAYQEGIRRSPRQLSIYRGLASLHAHGKKLQEALKVLDGAIAQPVTEPGYWLELSEHLEAVVRASGSSMDSVKERMTTVLGRIKTDAASDPAVLNRLADRFKAIEAWAPAQALYEDLLTRAPLGMNIREKLIDVYLRQGKKEEAGRQLEIVGRDNATNPQVQFYLGRVFFSERSFKRAQECFERTILLDPDQVPAYYELVRLMLSQGKTKEAAGFMERARTRPKFRSSFISEFYSALIQSQLKDYKQALRHITEAEVIGRAEDVTLAREFYYQYGSILERNGDREAAVKIFRKALDLSPDYPEAQNYLGYMWAEKGENLNEAHNLIQKALKAEPDNAAFLDSMGWVLHKLGRHREALKYLEQAIAKSDEPDATLFEHLGDVHWALTDKDKARAAWKKSLEAEENPEVRQKLERTNQP